MRRKQMQVKSQAYQPGDLVTCIVPAHLAHLMIVSERRKANGQPWVIHNIGAGVQEEDRHFEFEITGRYRSKIPEAAGGRE